MVPCKPNGVAVWRIKDTTISMPRLTVMYKDSSWSFQKSVTTLRKGLFATPGIFTEAFCTPDKADNDSRYDMK